VLSSWIETETGSKHLTSKAGSAAAPHQLGRSRNVLKGTDEGGEDTSTIEDDAGAGGARRADFFNSLLA
jgi:hypothetical protein